MGAEPILATVTGELFQPVRLHYRVTDQAGLVRAFKKLRCLDRDRTRPRWVWLYDYEARGLPFKQSYAQLPKPLRPVVIGSFFPRAEGELLLDVRSCERALLAVPFFDKHLPRGVARLTEAEVVNKLFPATGNASLTPDAIFDGQRATVRDPEVIVRRMKEITADVRDPREKVRIAMEEMNAGAREPLPEVERFPVHFYEDGIDGFALALRLRQTVAMQHWLGHADYSLFDALQAALGSV
jgi:hypothetical protein